VSMINGVIAGNRNGYDEVMLQYFKLLHSTTQHYTAQQSTAEHSSNSSSVIHGFLAVLAGW